MKSHLSLQKVSSAYRQQQVLQDIDLDIFGDEILCVLGPSGSGKSTVLKSIAGLQPISSGRIELNGTVLNDVGVHQPPQQRGIGLIFQDYALFPHLRVVDNIAFSGQANASEVAKLIELLGLQGLEQRFPHEISGGQQQRVAIARAMAYQPAFLLMDEPFSNIDQQTRWPLIRELHDIFRAQKIGVVFVTHSIDEAFYLADRVAILDQGRVLQCSVPESLYRQPNNLAVAEFLDLGLCFEILSRQADTLQTVLGEMKVVETIPDDHSHVFITSEQLTVAESVDGFKIIQKQRLAHGISYHVSNHQHSMRLTLAVDQDFAVGTVLNVQIKPHKPWSLSA
ncbi:ABC transporter ATP-binding protein [Marinicella sp. W31]|uniref:ABC transporter ATP-binding protein n=1 Tax=Marinicella sp. W31 TaxID=3023713 RepID=UPI0037582EC4